MAQLSRLENLPGDFELPISAMEILISEEFDMDSLRFATKEDLKEIGIKSGSILKIVAWQNSLRKSPKTRKSKSKSPNKTSKNISSNAAEPPRLFRQTTIADTLLGELVGDDGLRKTMDAIMLQNTEGITVRQNTIHLNHYTTFIPGQKTLLRYYSNITNKGKTLFYNWLNQDGRLYCHLSLKDDNLHPHRNSKARDIVGRFHLRWDLGGEHFYRRILVNDNNGVIELTRCSMKDFEIDEMTEIVLRCIREYYIMTRGQCNIVPGRC